MKENKTLSFLEKAKKVMQDYNKATGCSFCIYDGDFMPHLPDNINGCPEKTICPYCPKCLSGQQPSGISQNAAADPPPEPCYDLHVNAIKEANKKGSSHIYRCEMGFLFWTSPIYTNGSFYGAVRGGGFLTDIQKPVDIFLNANDTNVMCNSEISKEEYKERLSASPVADAEKAQSMAEMMQLCAESLSSGTEDYHGIVKRRAEQQAAISKIIDDLRGKYGGVFGHPEKIGYPLDKEKILLSALRKGDVQEAKKTLNELLALVIFSNPDQFGYVQLRITELVVLISRVEMSPARSGNLSMEINVQTLKQVQEAKTIEELIDIIHTVVERVTGSIASFKGIPHAAALRKAENFILENFTKKISLKEIADVAGLSPPYFSTIFKEEMGDNLSKYLNRLRVEKASCLLLETDMSLGEIAASCCFEDQSWFSKIFKVYTGTSPGKYRNQGGNR